MQPATFPAAPLRAALLLCALVLAGCATSHDPAAGPPSVERAERLLRQNDPVAAAQVYERLAATNPPPDGPGFSLSAARAWITAGRADDADRVLATLGATLSPAQQLQRSLLQVEVLVARGRYADAWRQVAAIAEPRDPAQAQQLFRLRQQVALRAGQPVEAVRAGMARERVATSDAERTAARRDLLLDLRQAIEGGLRVDPAASREPLVRGWLEIGQVAANAARSPLGAATAVQRWQGRYPGHPATAIAMGEIVTLGESAAGTGRALSGPIGLLLPLTGRQAVAASLVRDGFLAAIAQLPEGQRPDVRVYDTGVTGVDTVLQNARSEAVGMLVGPLTREEVLSAAQLHSGNVPQLLLNSLGAQGAPRGVYQFALSPEDEARQIARLAYAAGQRRAIVLAPTGDWGTRVTAAFTEELTRAGGSVVTQSNYDPARGEYTGMITEALHINDSRARHRRVQQIVGGELQFEARRRDDIDLIFAAGQQPLTLRQIHPQLRFFGAGDVPTWMTSDGYDPDPLAVRDLEGIRFVDMPWVLDTIGPVADTRAATAPVWADRGQRLSKLFAFGYDAATIALSIGFGQTAAPVAGLTGRLSITPDGHVERELAAARISSGTARQTPAAGE